MIKKPRSRETLQSQTPLKRSYLSQKDTYTNIGASLDKILQSVCYSTLGNIVLYPNHINTIHTQQSPRYTNRYANEDYKSRKVHTHCYDIQNNWLSLCSQVNSIFNLAVIMTCIMLEIVPMTTAFLLLVITKI